MKNMVRSPGLAPSPAGVVNAKGRVSIQKVSEAEEMTVQPQGLPANTEFDLFALSVPNFPFGLRGLRISRLILACASSIVSFGNSPDFRRNFSEPMKLNVHNCRYFPENRSCASGKNHVPI